MSYIDFPYKSECEINDKAINKIKIIITNPYRKFE